jgi:5'-nucleotidase
MSNPRKRKAAAGLAVLAAAAMSVAVASPSEAESIDSAAAATSTLDLKLLAINDLHGNLEPPTGSSARIQVPDANGAPVNVNAGGTEYLATHLKALRAEAAAEGASTVTVAAGDLIGASPLLSAAFHDEPTIEALNLMGLDYASVGNHEFDEGSAELLRVQNGGCHPVDG